MLKNIFTTIFICCCFSDSFSQIRINEFMQSNVNTIMDELNDFPDSWIELHNTSDKGIDISGWYIGEKNNVQKCWKLNNGYISANGFLLIYADKVGTGLHTDFRMETTKSSELYLFDQYGNLIDKVLNIPPQPAPNISYGIASDDNWHFFIKATPGKENNTNFAEELSPDPVFVVPAGIYNKAIEIEFNKPLVGKIYFTTDGSEPDETSDVYTNPFLIHETTVVKAKIIAENHLIPWSVAKTYIITDRELTLPIVSLSTDDKFLYDDLIGIYTKGTNGTTGPCSADSANYRQNWRRPVNIEYFPSSNSEAVINQLGEMRIMGGCSREHDLKSLAIYSHKRFGKKLFSYPFFQSPDKKNVLIKSFLLRNSGNDYMMTYQRDASIQQFMAGIADIDYQAYQPAIVYLNGTYWGMMNIRERSNEDYVYGNYDELEDIDMIENWNNPFLKGEVKTGDSGTFDYLMAGLYDNLFTYEKIENFIDIPEFINYTILQMFIANTDYPANNHIMWRNKLTDGKWRFLLKDTDFGCGYLPEINPDFDALDYLLNYGTQSKNDELSTRLFRTLMEHEAFRKEFFNYFTVYLGDLLSSEKTIQIVDSISNIISTEFPYHAKRWSYRDNRENELIKMKSWLTRRNPRQYQLLNDYFNLDGTERLTINHRKKTSLNGVGLVYDEFDGMYYINTPFIIKTTNSEFKAWKINYLNSGKEEFHYTPEVGITFTEPLHIEFIDKTTDIRNIENPDVAIYSVNGKLLVEIPDKISTINIYDISGQKVKSEYNITQLETVLPANGIYIVEIINSSGNFIRKIRY